MNTRKGLLLLFLVSLIISCKNPTGNNNNNDNNKNNSNNNDNESEIKTGRVTFVNESSYSVIVHLYSFSGPMLTEVPSTSRTKTVDVRVSDDQLYGTIFFIEYISIIQIIESVNGEIIETSVSAIDPGVQINRVIKEGKSCTVQIPKPQNIEFRTAFIKLINTSDLPCELKDNGRILPLTNGSLTVVPYRTGIYKLTGIPPEGELYQGYHVSVPFKKTPVPDCLMMNGKIEIFTYDGNTVEHTGTDTFIWK